MSVSFCAAPFRVSNFLPLVSPLVKYFANFHNFIKMGRRKGDSKRQRERDSSTSSEARPPANSSNSTKVSTASALQQLTGAVNAQTQMGTNLTKRFEEIVTSVSAMGSKLDSVGNRVSDVEQGLSQCMDTLSKHDRDIQFLLKHIREVDVSKKQMDERAEALESRLAMAEKQEFSQADDSFDRPPNPTVLKINAKVNISKDAFEASLSNIVEKARLPVECFRVQGPPVSRYFTVQFTGAPNLAKERASQVLKSLRHDDGTWERVLVKDPQDQLVQVFLGPDKAPKQIRVEVLSKKLANILESQGFSEVHVNRRQGQICVSWRPVAMVEVESRDSTDILWDTEYAGQLGIDRARVNKSFKTIPSNASPVKWERLSCS